MRKTTAFLMKDPGTDREDRTGSRGKARRSIIAGMYWSLAPHLFSIRMLHVVTLCTIGLFVSNAYAHETGDWLLKLGVTQVSPKSDNGSALDDTVDLDDSSNVRPSFTITYIATTQIGLELLAIFPYHNDIRKNSALAKIGSTRKNET